jgi:hypothetical protein
MRIVSLGTTGGHRPFVAVPQLAWHQYGDDFSAERRYSKNRRQTNLGRLDIDGL